MKSFFKKNDSLDTEVISENSENKVYDKIEIKKDKKMRDGNITTLTPDVEIKGTIKFSKVLEMNGKFEGELITNDGEVIVGATGDVKANFSVKNAVVEGKVTGNVTAAEKVELKNRAQLIGDITAKTLSIEEGVLFVGKCNVNPNGIKDVQNKKSVEKE